MCDAADRLYELSRTMCTKKHTCNQPRLGTTCLLSSFLRFCTASHRIVLHSYSSLGEPPGASAHMGLLNLGPDPKPQGCRMMRLQNGCMYKKLGLVQRKARSQCRMTASYGDGSSKGNSLAAGVQNLFKPPCAGAVSPSCPLCMCNPYRQHADKIFSVLAATDFRLAPGCEIYWRPLGLYCLEPIRVTSRKRTLSSRASACSPSCNVCARWFHGMPITTEIAK